MISYFVVCGLPILLCFGLSLPVECNIRSAPVASNFDLAIDDPESFRLPDSSNPPEQLTYIQTRQRDLEELIYNVLERTANHSWEWGTQAEVILERYYPSLSVYSPTRNIPLDSKDELPYPQKLFEVIEPILEKRSPGPGPIIVDGASGDPASLLVGLMVCGASESIMASIQQSYNEIAQEQILFLIDRVPRTPEGAISHRVAEIQLWADFMYMAPPSIAYFGAATFDENLLEFSYTQTKLYRQALQDPRTKTWRHMALGNEPDETLWSTGNGWAAAGMMRIWATMNNVNDDYLRARSLIWRMDLLDWVTEIVSGAFVFQSDTSHLLPNRYADNNTYDEVSGTALITSAAFRLLAAHPDSKYRLPVEQIERARGAVLANNIDPLTGIVSPVVDPLDWNKVGPLDSSKSSPEGQAFVLLMIEAWEALHIN